MGLRALYLDREGASTYATDGERQIREAIEADDREKKRLAQEPEARALALNRLNSRLGMPEEDYKTSWGKTNDSGIEAAQRSMDGTSIGSADNARYNSPQTNKWAEKAQSSPYMGAAEDVRYDTLPKAPPIPVPSIAPSKPLEFNNSWANNATPNNEDRPFSWSTLPEAMRPNALTNLVPKPAEPASFNMGAAEGTRYNSPQDNKWMAGEPPAIAQAVARKRRDPSAFLSEMQSGFIDPYRLHTANIANQMRTAISDASQAVPGVKPLANMDYRQPVMDEIGYRKDVEARDRQRLQDQMAYMKQLEGEDGTADWTVVDTKTGPIQHNKRTGEVKPLGTYGGSTSGPVGKLTHKTDDVLDSNGNIVKQDFFLDEAGGFFVYSNGVLSATDPNNIPWAYKNKGFEAAQKLTEKESEDNRKRLENLSTLNLNKDLSVAFKDQPTKVRAATAVKATTDVAEAWKTVNADKEFQELTTPTNNPIVDAKKVYAYHLWAQKNMWMQQAVLAAQANMMNSGVMQVGERENYLAAAAGLPTDIFSNPAYKLNKNIELALGSLINGAFSSAATGLLAAKDMEVIQDKLIELAKARPDLLDPAGPRKALEGITKRSILGTQQLIERESMRSRDMPTGSYSADSYDPRIGTHFTGMADFSKPVVQQGPSGYEPIGTDPAPRSPYEPITPLIPVKKTPLKVKTKTNARGATVLKTTPNTPNTPAQGTVVDWGTFNKGTTK